MIALHPFSARAGRGQAHLRILATTDLHAHALSYDYYADRPVDTGGLSRVAAMAGLARAEAANALLVDNGDFLQGNPLGDFVASARGVRAGDLHPIIAAMNAAGFDAATIGNHDFDYGLDFLLASLAGARFPVVGANVALALGADPTRDRTLVPPWTILDRHLADGAGERHPIRIGLIGVLPPQTAIWDRQHLEGRVQVRDIVAAARAWVPRMKEEGADLVIALTHSGIGPPACTEGMEHAAVPLARVEGIDALVTGHQHLVLPGGAFAGIEGVDAAAGTIHGKPAVMAGAFGSHLGVIDLLLRRDGGTWRVVDRAAAARPVFRRNADRSISALVGDAPEVVEAVRAAHEATLAHVRRPVGRTAAPLHSYFGLVADDPSLRVVNQAQRWYIARMLAGTGHAALPLLSAAAPFKSGGRSGPDHYTDIPAGAVALRNVADLYVYPNRVCAVKVTGAELADWLERAAGIFNRIVPGLRDQRLLNPDFPAYNFDVIDGVSYRIDLSQPARFGPDGSLADARASRIRDLTHRGRPVDPGAAFVIATNSYRAGGGGAFPGAGGGTVIFEAPDSNRDVILRYFMERDTVEPAGEGGWSFVPMPGTSVIFDTGPGAAVHLADLRGPAIEPLGARPDGFLRFRISL